MNTELIVPFNKNNQRMTCNIILFLIVVLVFIFYWSLSLHTFLNYYALIIIKGILPCFISLLVVILGSWLRQIKNNEPAAILNQKGIWVKNWGFIPWGNIEEIDTYLIQNMTIKLIGIRLKNLTLFSKQTSFSGRIGIFFVQLCGYHYHITLTESASENPEVVAFSKQFIK